MRMQLLKANISRFAILPQEKRKRMSVRERDCRVHKYFRTMTELQSIVSLNILQTTLKSLVTCNAAVLDKELGKMLNPN